MSRWLLPLVIGCSDAPGRGEVPHVRAGAVTIDGVAEPRVRMSLDHASWRFDHGGDRPAYIRVAGAWFVSRACRHGPPWYEARPLIVTTRGLLAPAGPSTQQVHFAPVALERDACQTAAVRARFVVDGRAFDVDAPVATWPVPEE